MVLNRKCFLGSFWFIFVNKEVIKTMLPLTCLEKQMSHVPREHWSQSVTKQKPGVVENMSVILLTLTEAAEWKTHHVNSHDSLHMPIFVYAVRMGQRDHHFSAHFPHTKGLILMFDQSLSLSGTVPQVRSVVI